MPEYADWITLAGVVAIIAFLWNVNRDRKQEVADLRKDIAALGERMARLEGLFEGFVGRKDTPAE